MLPPPAADTVDSLDIKKALAVLLAMDPNRAAEVLVEMGAAAAAQKLVAMDPDARNCIIENMAPKAAAITLVSMEDLLERGATEAGQVCALANRYVPQLAQQLLHEINHLRLSFFLFLVIPI